MTQLLARRWRGTVSAQIHRSEATHHITTPPRRWGIKQTHNIRHATAGRRSGTVHPIRRRGTTCLCTCRSGPIKVNIEEILNIALRSSGSTTVGSSGGGGDRCSDRVLCGVLALLLDGGALNGIGTVTALSDKRLRGFVVD